MTRSLVLSLREQSALKRRLVPGRAATGTSSASSGSMRTPFEAILMRRIRLSSDAASACALRLTVSGTSKVPKPSSLLSVFSLVCATAAGSLHEGGRLTKPS